MTGDNFWRVEAPTVLDPKGSIPERATPGSAGYDLMLSQDDHVGYEWRPLRTGLYVAIPRGFAGLIKARSGLATKDSVEIFEGVIDSDYRGEILVLARRALGRMSLHQGQRIAQLLVVPVAKVEFQLVSKLPETERGKGGFGSTGNY